MGRSFWGDRGDASAVRRTRKDKAGLGWGGAAPGRCPRRYPAVGGRRGLPAIRVPWTVYGQRPPRRLNARARPAIPRRHVRHSWRAGTSGSCSIPVGRLAPGSAGQPDPTHADGHRAERVERSREDGARAMRSSLPSWCRTGPGERAALASWSLAHPHRPAWGPGSRSPSGRGPDPAAAPPWPTTGTEAIPGPPTGAGSGGPPCCRRPSGRPGSGRCPCGPGERPRGRQGHPDVQGEGPAGRPPGGPRSGGPSTVHRIRWTVCCPAPGGAWKPALQPRQRTRACGGLRRGAGWWRCRRAPTRGGRPWRRVAARAVGAFGGGGRRVRGDGMQASDKNAATVPASGRDHPAQRAGGSSREPNFPRAVAWPRAECPCAGTSSSLRVSRLPRHSLLRDGCRSAQLGSEV